MIRITPLHKFQVTKVYSAIEDESGTPVYLGHCTPYTVEAGDRFLQVAYLIEPPIPAVDMAEFLHRLRTQPNPIGKLAYALYHLVLYRAENGDLEFVIKHVIGDDDPGHLRGWCAAYYG